MEALMEETDAEFDDRLCRVIAKAETTFYPQDYVWKPLAQGSSPSSNALACVADHGIWHEFVPATTVDTQGRFRVVLFKFSEDGPSAIGFVAWLHSNLRRMGKTGAIVICGKDHRGSKKLFEVCQGAMDYWACPVGPAGDRFVDVIRTLIQKGAVLT
jgi:hypothetical protein